MLKGVRSWLANRAEKRANEQRDLRIQAMYARAEQSQRERQREEQLTELAKLLINYQSSLSLPLEQEIISLGRELIVEPADIRKGLELAGVEKYRIEVFIQTWNEIAGKLLEKKAK